MAPLLTGYAFALCFLAAFVWARSRQGRFEVDLRRSRRSAFALGAVHSFGLVAPAIGFAFFDHDVSIGATGGAVAIMAAALALQLWAQRSLGPCFTLSLQCSQGQPLSREGPYRWVRHPAYLVQLLFWAALGVASRSWAIAGAVAAVALAGYGYRTAAEEAMMREALGEGYRQYAAITKRFLPLLW